MSDALSQLLKKGFVDHGLLSSSAKIEYLRHPLLLWHVGGRRGETQDDGSIRRGSEWNYRFLGVGGSHLRVLGLSPDQGELDNISDLEVERRARTLYESKLYFQGGFAALLRTPPANSDESTYNAVALRRMMWLITKKVGTLSPNMLMRAMSDITGLTIGLTKADAREVFPSKKLSKDELDTQWAHLLSTFRIPTLHFVGSATAGFLMEMGQASRRVDERAFQLWSGRTEWVALDGRSFKMTLVIPPIQLLLAAGSVRAILSRCGDGQNRVWDPVLWEQVTHTMETLPEGAWNLLMHALMASDDSVSMKGSGNPLPHVENIEWAHQILGVAPGPYTDRRMRHKIQGILKAAASNLLDHYRMFPGDPLAPWVENLGRSVLAGLASTGNTTRLITNGSDPMDTEVENNSPNNQKSTDRTVAPLLDEGDDQPLARPQTVAAGTQMGLFGEDWGGDSTPDVTPTVLLPGSFPFGDTLEEKDSPSVTPVSNRAINPSPSVTPTFCPPKNTSPSVTPGDNWAKDPSPSVTPGANEGRNASPSVTEYFPQGDGILPLGRQNTSPRVTPSIKYKVSTNLKNQTLPNQSCTASSNFTEGGNSSLSLEGIGSGLEGKGSSSAPEGEMKSFSQGDVKSTVGYRGHIESLVTLGTWVGWDSTHEAAAKVEQVLGHLLQTSTPNRPPLETQRLVREHRKGPWSVAGTWALCQAARTMGFPKLPGARTPGKFLDHWLALNFEQAANSSERLLDYMLAIMEPLALLETARALGTTDQEALERLKEVRIEPLTAAKTCQVVQAAPGSHLFGEEAVSSPNHPGEPVNEASGAWQAVREALRETLHENAFREFIGPLVCLGFRQEAEAPILRVGRLSLPIKQYFLDCYSEEWEQAASAAGMEGLYVEIVVV